MVLAMKCSTTPQMEEVVIGFMENRQPKTRLLSFHTNYDYVQLLVSNDMGQSWIPLESENTSLGTAFQDPGKPLYHGFNNEWVKETVSLSPFLGQSILLKFELLSDMSQKF